MSRRGVAQFGSALRSGRRGRGFKSRHPDQERRGRLGPRRFRIEKHPPVQAVLLGV